MLCLYYSQITSDTTSEIKGTHTTPVHDYVDDLSMELSGTANSCSVKVRESGTPYHSPIRAQFTPLFLILGETLLIQHLDFNVLITVLGFCVVDEYLFPFRLNVRLLMMGTVVIEPAVMLYNYMPSNSNSNFTLALPRV